MRAIIAIDLKSFYASVEARERGLDPLTTNLVVADASRTEKTICLAVSPSLKSCGISGRARLFEVVQRVREVNRQRLSDLARTGKAAGTGVSARTGDTAGTGASARTGDIAGTGVSAKPGGGGAAVDFSGESCDMAELRADPSLKLAYITATPRMALTAAGEIEQKQPEHVNRARFQKS